MKKSLKFVIENDFLFSCTCVGVNGSGLGWWCISLPSFLMAFLFVLACH